MNKFIQFLLLICCSLLISCNYQNHEISLETNNSLKSIIDSFIQDSLKFDTRCYKNPISSSDVVILPECTNLAEIRSAMTYPESAKKENIEGHIAIQLLIDTCGFVSKIESITGPEIFYDEVTRVCRYLRFIPAVGPNGPIKAWVTIPFRFKLNSQYSKDLD